MIPVRDHPDIAPQPWSSDRDNALPGDLKPYFLQAGSAPRYLLGSVVTSILAASAESAGRFSIGSIEGSSWHHDGPLSKKFIFETVHHAFMVTEGALDFTIGSDNATLSAGEIIYIPRKQPFSVSILSRYSKAYVFISGEGLLSALATAGQAYGQHIIPEKSEEWRQEDLKLLEAELQFTVN